MVEILLMQSVDRAIYSDQPVIPLHPGIGSVPSPTRIHGRFRQTDAGGQA